MYIFQPGCARDRDRTGKTALHYCAENAGPECVQLLLRAAPDLVNTADEEGYTVLHLAVIAGNKTMVRFLLETAGADPDALDSERHSCVHWATVCGELDVLDVLLDFSSGRKGAAPASAASMASVPDIHGAYPLHYAAQMSGQQHPQQPGGGGAKPLLGSNQQGIRALKRLIQFRVPVDVTDRDGRQPLLWAASSGSADAILALCNAGASVTAADKDGLTALHCAASRGHSDCLETLVTLCGADVDLTDKSGCTALFYAVTLGHVSPPPGWSGMPMDRDALLFSSSRRIAPSCCWTAEPIRTTRTKKDGRRPIAAPPRAKWRRSGCWPSTGRIFGSATPGAT